MPRGHETFTEVAESAPGMAEEHRLAVEAEATAATKDQKPITITPALIAAAERAGACEEALAWLCETPRTVEELANHYPAWAEWAAVSIPDLPDAVRDRLQALGAGRS